MWAARVTCLVLVLSAACGHPAPASQRDDAPSFIDRATRELGAAWFAQQRADFINATDATEEHGAAAARAAEVASAVTSRIVEEARAFRAATRPEVARQLALIGSMADPAPPDPGAAARSRRSSRNADDVLPRCV
ncbi:MAG: hypothetical protein IPQ07_39430 [Myxococcales bacterium]|nr:hypothetical protein [Myxococcales bacterium]